MGYLILLLLNLLFPFIGLGIILFFLISPRRNLLKNLRQELSERFLMSSPGQTYKSAIWIHAASVGEVRSIVKTAGELKAFYSRPIIITTSTAAGRDTANKELVFDKAVLMPVDFYPLIKKFIKVYKPYRLFVIESDMWPNMIVGCGRHDIPVGIINGRVSARSAKRYKLLSPLLKLVLRYITYICAQTEEIAQRYIDMGADSSRVYATGNIKYDMLNDNPARTDDVKDIIGMLGWTGKEILTCGSTHEEEESIILSAARGFKDLKIIIAPRHLERRKHIISMLNAGGFDYQVLSAVKKSGKAKQGSQILLADTMGWLGAFYQAATLTFVGGSISRNGGHNFLEAAVFSKPVLFGKYYYNTPDVAEKLLESGGAVLVSAANFGSVVQSFLGNGELLGNASVKAGETALSFKGATAKTISVVKNYERNQ